MKHIIFVILIVALPVLVAFLPSSSQVAPWPLCWATVVQAPPEGMPLRPDPSFRSVDVLGWFHTGDRVEVIAVHFNTHSEGIWFLVPGGYVQANTGRQNGGGPLHTTYLVADNVNCEAGLPHYTSDWWGQ